MKKGQHPVEHLRIEGGRTMKRKRKTIEEERAEVSGVFTTLARRIAREIRRGKHDNLLPTLRAMIASWRLMGIV